MVLGHPGDFLLEGVWDGPTQGLPMLGEEKIRKRRKKMYCKINKKWYDYKCKTIPFGRKADGCRPGGITFHS